MVSTNDGEAQDDRIRFELKTPDGGRVVTFNGTRTGDTIAFTRSVKVLGGDPGRDGILGANGATQFTAVLDSSPAAAASPVQTTTPPAGRIVTPSTGTPAGRWQVSEVSGAPWIFDLTVSGVLLSGTVRQIGTGSDPIPIAGGKITGTAISFKVLSPDGERILAFHGEVSGNEISFIREITVLDGGTRGGNGLYGGPGALGFVARRETQNLLNYRGMRIDIGAIQSASNRDAIVESLRRQIEIVDEAAMKPEQKAFLKTVPLSISPSFTGADNGNYTNALRGVVLSAGVFDHDKPVLLHELMHAYHDQKTPGGFRNAEILTLYQQARADQKFPQGSYMLSGVGEYFAMMASVYLHGTAARDPFTREAIKEKQPDCYKWLEGEFGAR